VNKNSKDKFSEVQHVLNKQLF